MVRRISVFLLASALGVAFCAEEQERKPVEEITNSLGMRLCYVPPGEFAMGSPADVNKKDEDEMPRRRVRITNGFYMGRTEVTRSQFAVFVREAAWETQAEREDWSYTWRNGSFQMVRGICFRSPGFSQTNEYPLQQSGLSRRPGPGLTHIPARVATGNEPDT